MSVRIERRRIQKSLVKIAKADDPQLSPTADDVMQAVIYCRVSDPRQKTMGHGLESQETRLREHARTRNYQVVSVFRDDISGQYAARDGLNDLFSFLALKPQKFIVLIDHASRLTRNFRDHWPLRDRILAAGATLESPEKRYADDPDPEEELHENIDVSVNHYHRRQNARQTKNRMKARLMNGYWCFHAPIGYVFQEVEGHGKLMVRNEPVATLIAEVLEGYAHGRFQSYAEVMRYLKQHPHYPAKSRWSLPVERVKEILEHEGYAGYITLPKWELNLIQGKHEPLISFETHKRILDRMAGRALAPARKNISHDFPLRQFILCAGCDRPLTGCWSKSRNGTRHPYYICQTKGCDHYGKSSRRADVETEFAALIKSITPVQQAFDMGMAMFRKAWGDQIVSVKSQTETLKAELRKLDASIAQLLDRIVDTNSPTVIRSYENRIEELEAQKAIMRERIANSGRPLKPLEVTFRTALEFFKNPCRLWDSEHLEDKRAMLKMVFKEPLIYERNVGFRTAITSCPFKVFVSLFDQKLKVVPLR